MGKYAVMVFETLHKDVVVEASDAEEAIEKVATAYENGAFEMSMDDFVADMTDYDCLTLEEAIQLDEIDQERCIEL